MSILDLYTLDQKSYSFLEIIGQRPRQIPTDVPYGIQFNYTDANGYTRILVLDDVTSPPLSGAAAIFNHRPTGTLPNNRTGDGVEGIAQTTGTLLNTPTGYVLSGVEASAVVSSSGQSIPEVWALHTNATMSGSTNVTNLVSAWIQAPTNTGTGNATNAYGMVLENVNAVGTTANITLWAKGNSRIDGTATINGLVTITVGAGNTAKFLSGGAAAFAYFDLGRTAEDIRFAVAGAANDFIATSAQGDALIFTMAAKKLFIGTNQAVAITIDGSQQTLFSVKMFPPTDAGATQTASAISSGTGAPNNANGANGDYYHRSDGTAAPTATKDHIYFKSGGAWGGIA